MAKKISSSLVATIKLAAEQMNGKIPYKEPEELDKIQFSSVINLKVSLLLMLSVARKPSLSKKEKTIT